MKNVLRTIGIIALAAVIGFGMMSCGDSGGGGGSGSFKFDIKNEHATLTITEIRVYEVHGDWDRKGGAKLTKTGLNLGNNDTSELYTASGFKKGIAGHILFEVEVKLSDDSTDNVYDNPDYVKTYNMRFTSSGYLDKE